MATVASKNQTGLGSNGASSPNEGTWRNYAVPPDNEKMSDGNGNTTWQEQYGHGPIYATNGRTGPDQRRTPSTEPNRLVRLGQTTDVNKLAPTKSKTILRKTSDTSGANGSDADSLLELYSRSTDNLRTVPWTEPTPGVKRKGSANASVSDRTLADKWIHRDKLAQIENREMREFGLKVGGRSSSRMANQSSSATSGTGEQHETEKVDDPIQEVSKIRSNPSNSDKRQRLMTPQQLTDDEVADADMYEYQEQDALKMQSKRPATSRIPVSRVVTSSPTSQELDTQGTNAESQWQRSQDISGTSQPVPIGAGGQGSMDFSNSSPPKAKPTTKSSSPASRNAFASKNSPAQRSTSGPGSPSSPGRQSNSRDGNARPTTARPEGEPPWIATMFKPDPRLPPDQQMLPTHAKRLAQEQGYTFDELDPERSEYRLVENDALAEEAQVQPQTFRSTTAQITRTEASAQPTDMEPEQPRYYQANQLNQIQYNNSVAQSNQLQYNQQGQIIQQPIIKPQTFHLPPENEVTSEHQFDYQDPEKAYGYPWPLKTPSPQNPGTPSKFEGNSPRNSKTAGKINEDSASNLQNRAETSKKLSPPVPRQDHKEKREARLPRLPESVEDERDKKKGCGCCIVM